MSGAGIIYKITNLITNKIYIGKTKQSLKRKGLKGSILEKEYVGQWINQVQCAKDLNICDKSINQCLTKPNRNKSHKNYLFKYKD